MLHEQNPRRKVTIVLPNGDSLRHSSVVSVIKLYEGSRDSTVKRWCLGQSGTAAEQGTPQRREYDGRESLEFRMDMEVGDSGVDSSGLSEIAGSPAFEASFEGHTDWVNDCCLVGGILITCSSDTTVKCWKHDASGCDGGVVAPLHTFLGHSDYVMCLASAPQAGFVVSAGCLGEAFLWNIDAPTRGTPIGTPMNVPGASRHSTYAADCLDNAGLIALGSTSGAVRVWDPRANTYTHDLHGHQGNVRALRLSRDGLAMLSGGSDRTVRFWDLRKHQCTGVFSAHGDSVWGLTADDTLSEFVSWDRAGHVLWTETRTGETALLVRERGPVHALAIEAKGGGSGSERTLWTSSDGSDVRRWDIPSRHDMHLRRPESASRSPYARSSPILSGGTGRSRAASSAATRSVAAAARPSQEIRGVAPLTQFRVLPDKRHVLVGDSEGRLSLWDVAIGQEVERYGAGMKFSEKYRELFKPVVVSPWFQADVRLGSLALILDPATCFSAEIYATEVGLSSHTEETKLNFGGQVISGVFAAWALRKGLGAEVQRRLEYLFGRGSPEAQAVLESARQSNGPDASGGGGGGRGRDVTDAQRDVATGGGEASLSGRRPAFAYTVGKSAVVMCEGNNGEPWRAVAGEMRGTEREGSEVPMWVAAWVSREEMPQGMMERYRAQNEPKVTFQLLPAEGSGLPELPQVSLQAPKILQVRKAVSYVQQRLKELDLPMDAHDPVQGGGGGEAVLEVLAKGHAVPWGLTLAALKHYVFKGGDIVLHYRRGDPANPAPVLRIEPPPKDS